MPWLWKLNKTELDLGTYSQFKQDLPDVFAPNDSPRDALEKMKTLQMKKDDSIKEFIAKFKMLVR